MPIAQLATTLLTIAEACLLQWRSKKASHELAAAMLAVANVKHAVWRPANSSKGCGGLTCERLAKLLRHQQLPVRLAIFCRHVSHTCFVDHRRSQRLCCSMDPVVGILFCRWTCSCAPVMPAVAAGLRALLALWWMPGTQLFRLSPRNLQQVAGRTTCLLCL
jgi:hypothetical protein